MLYHVYPTNKKSLKKLQTSDQIVSFQRILPNFQIMFFSKIHRIFWKIWLHPKIQPDFFSEKLMGSAFSGFSKKLWILGFLLVGLSPGHWSLILTGMNLTQATVQSICRAPKVPTNNVKIRWFVELGMIWWPNKIK